MNISEILSRKGSSVVTTGPDAHGGRRWSALLAEHKIGRGAGAGRDQSSASCPSAMSYASWPTVGADVLGMPVSALMTAELVTPPPGDSLDATASLMTERRIRHLPVLAGGELAGIVTIGDVVAARLRELEQTREQLENYITQG